MAWLKVDDNLHQNPKILTVGLDGTGLYVQALSYAAHQASDGFIPREWTRRSGARPKLIQRLEVAGLWKAVEGGEIFSVVDGDGKEYVLAIPGPGHFIRDFVSYNPTKRALLEQRAKRARAGQLGGLAAQAARRADSVRTDSDIPF